MDLSFWYRPWYHFYQDPVGARTRGSHRVYKLREHTMSFQDANGYAKPYQVRQLLEAIDSLRKEGG